MPKTATFSWRFFVFALIVFASLSAPVRAQNINNAAAQELIEDTNAVISRLPKLLEKFQNKRVQAFHDGKTDTTSKFSVPRRAAMRTPRKQALQIDFQNDWQADAISGEFSASVLSKKQKERVMFALNYELTTYYWWQSGNSCFLVSTNKANVSVISQICAPPAKKSADLMLYHQQNGEIASYYACTLKQCRESDSAFQTLSEQPYKPKSNEAVAQQNQNKASNPSEACFIGYWDGVLLKKYNWLKKSYDSTTAYTFQFFADGTFKYGGFYAQSTIYRENNSSGGREIGRQTVYGSQEDPDWVGTWTRTPNILTLAYKGGNTKQYKYILDCNPESPSDRPDLDITDPEGNVIVLDRYDPPAP